MTKLTTILLAGVATLAFTACGSSSSSTGGTTPPVEDTTTIPLSVNGNQILVPGYVYPARAEDIIEMYVAESGNVLFTGGRCAFYAYDANFNDYQLDEYGNKAYFTTTEYFEAGMYYIVAKSNKTSVCNMSVQSDVLIVPQ